MAAGDSRNAEAIVAASRPSTTWSISGARIAASMAGWAQTNISLSRWSGIADAGSISTTSPAITCMCSAPLSAVRRRRAASMDFRRATVSSHASGLSGVPWTGQSARAAANASESASSAAATSPVRAARKATSLP